MIDLYLATIGFAILLFLLMGVFIYFVASGLNKEDSFKIDPLPPDTTLEEPKD
jgi:hypothetical protein